MIHGKITCPKCSTHFEVSLTAAPSQQSQAAKVGASASTDELGELLESIDENALDGKNADFVSDMKGRYAQYGARTIISDKQMGWLRKLAGA